MAGFGRCSIGVDCAAMAVIIQMLTNYVPPLSTGSVLTKYYNASPTGFNPLKDQMCEHIQTCR